MKKPILDQVQKITGTAKRRVCLWNRKLADAGFAPGEHFATIIDDKSITLRTRPQGEGTRAVALVMNHGNELPVIDLKETRKVSFEGWGDKARVVIEKYKITITPEN